MESVSIIVKGNVQKICSKVFFVYTGKNKKFNSQMDASVGGRMDRKTKLS